MEKFKKEEKKMKRPLTLTGFIIGTVALGIQTIFELIGIALIFELLTATGAPGAIVFGVVGLLTIALVVVSLVFNILGITAWNKNAEGYQKKRKFVITAVVLNFVVVLLMLIGMLMGSFSVISLIVMLALIATNVLAIVDLAREKNKVAPVAAEETVEE